MAEPAKPQLSTAGRAYVALVGWGGASVFVYCVTLIARDGVPNPTQCLIFAALTFASGRFTFKVPSVEARFSLAEMFGFTSVLLFGPAPGAITLAMDSLVLSWRHRMSRSQTLFNFGNLAFAVWCSGSLFFWLAGAQPLFKQPTPADGLIIPVALMAASYFLINSGLIAAAIAFQGRKQPFGVWRSHFMWLGPGYAAAASVSLLVVVLFRQANFSAMALLLPVLVVSYHMLRSSFGRLEDAKQHVDRLNGLYLSTIETLATAIDAKDDVTHSHVRRVQGAAVALAREMGITDPQIVQAIEAAALLHDTGKIAVPEHILNKPARLTPAEYEKMKLHAPIGADILSSIDFPYPVVPIVRHHHENWDGTGYPDKLRGTDIPIGARILSVVDCFDALTSDRPYRRRMTDEDALRIVLERRGTMYDPLVVDTFARTYRQIMPAPDSNPHPAARAVVRGAHDQQQLDAHASTTTADSAVIEEMVAFSSLSRAISGEATFNDAGALVWMLIRQVVPCSAMALFAPDDASDTLTARFAMGAQSRALRQMRYPMSQGAVGWSAVNRRPIANSEVVMETAQGLPPDEAMQWICTVPLEHEGALVAVLALYAPRAKPFTEQQAHILDLLAPRLAATLASAPAGRAGTSDLQLVRGARAS